MPEDLKEEVYPKNILLVGPTGCGKTEVSKKDISVSYDILFYKFYQVSFKLFIKINLDC